VRRILVVAAHPDDEVLGCGATIAKHVESGDHICIAFMANGVGSRDASDKSSESRKSATQCALNVLGVNSIRQFDFPDNKMDSIPLLDVVQAIEKLIEELRPEVIYTHYAGDLNIDHQVTHQAVITACRPQPSTWVKEIYSFEVLSSTHWQSQSMANVFNPQYFVNVEQFIEQKIKALECYDEEIRPYPHARSYKSIRALAMHRGATVGIMHAEAFQIERIICS